MLTKEALKRDVRGRIERIQAMMKEKDVGALLIVASGGPGGLGALRYISNVHLWSGAAYGVLGDEDPDPWVLIWSSYQAVWTRNETTTSASRVQSPRDPLARAAELAKEYAQKSKRIGIVNMNKLLPVGAYGELIKTLRGYELVEVTKEYNSIRQIKTPFEIEAFEQNGALLDACMDVFREHARPGALYWQACAAAEAFLKAQGAFWGRTKLSLNITPYTVPPPRNLRIRKDHIINFEVVYESPWGYWTEMTSVFSFSPLPDEVQKLLGAYLLAVENSAAAAKPGNPLRMISETNDETFARLGYQVAGKHTPDCHSIGLDGSDGPSSESDPEFVLKSNMVLSFHPGTVLEDDRGLLISDNFLVTPEGAVRLSPHSAHRYWLQLDE